MVGLVLAATWVRLWQFPAIPPALNYDEAYNAVDALWLADSGAWLTFLPGNTGRHALFHYLMIPFLRVLGVNIFAVRFLSVVIGVLVVPLVYRMAAEIFAPLPERRFLGLAAATGLAFSFWHIALSRSGFRASLLLLLLILTIYLFWRGRQRGSAWSIAAAGVTLGLSQYTYWLAMLLPLVFGLFAVAQTLLCLRQTGPSDRDVRQTWRWIGLMALVSFIVFLPLGWQYVQTPAVLGYVTQSSITEKMAATRQTTWTAHLLTAVRIYVDGPVALWQGRAAQSLGFDWLALAGFWLGLVTAVKNFRRPPYLFLLGGLLVLWLPAPLNDIDFSNLRLPDMLPVNHAISNLRLAGVLPVYYTLSAVGVYTGIRWVGQKLQLPNRPVGVGLIAFLLIFTLSGGVNIYNFFVRWPAQPFLYERYNGPILELAQDLARESAGRDILIPFHLYGHPTMHFVFDRLFTEVDTPPDGPPRPAILVTTANAPVSAYMWLARPENGPGAAYLTPALDVSDLLQQSNGQVLKTYNLAAPLMFSAQTTLIPNLEPLRPTLANWPALPGLNYTWGGELRLAGYRLMPRQVRPGESLNITLYWQNLVDQPQHRDIFLHAVNSRGEGVGQVDGIELSDGHRWRAGKLTPTHHIMQLGDTLGPGPYLLRLGLFNGRTGARLPVLNATGDYLGNQVLFGLFYIVDDNRDPTRPDTPVTATLGRQIQLTGYSLATGSGRVLRREQTGNTLLRLKTYWQAVRPVNGDYTIFVQLLNSRNEFVAGFDTPPLNGNYPTSIWQPGEVVAQEIELAVPAAATPGNYRLVTGMYNFQTGQRQPAAGEQGQPLPDGMVPLARLQITAEQISVSGP